MPEIITNSLKLSDLGEREVIDILVGKQRDIDDCAVLNCGDTDLLLSTDLITRATHLPEGTSPFLAGKFFAAINLSDIAAMAGIPEGMLVSISVFPGYDIQYLQEFYKGITYELSRFNASIIGGDTKEGEDFTASGTIIGRQKPELVRKRSYIAPGQQLFVTNSLGSAAAGYIYYKYGRDRQEGIKKMLDIEPRISEAQKISENGAKFMMDLSDGIYASIYQMHRDFGTGFRIYMENIPVASSVAEASKISGFSIEDIALSFGGDYELLFTIDNKDTERFMDAMKNEDIDVHKIGETYNGINEIHDGSWRPVNNRGYEHFKDVPLNK